MGWGAYRQGHRPSWLTPKYLPLRQLNQVSARRQWKQARGPARRGWNTLLGTPRRGIKGEDRKVKEHGSSSGNGAGGCLRERSVVGEKATVTARRLFQKFPLLYQLLLCNQSSTVVSSSLEQCSLIDYLRGLARLMHTCAFTAGTVQGTAWGKNLEARGQARHTICGPGLYLPSQRISKQASRACPRQCLPSLVARAMVFSWKPRRRIIGLHAPIKCWPTVLGILLFHP